MTSYTVIAGVDGSAESRIAAGWAAHEARLRDASLRLVHAWVRQPYEYTPLAGVQSPLPPRDGVWTGDEPPLLVGARLDLQKRHPGLVVSAEEVAEEAVPALLDAARDADVLVLGSRRLGAITGFLVGSVALGAVAHAERPVVLAGEGDRGEPGIPQGRRPSRDVVLGLDVRRPADPLLTFAFDAANRRTARLRVVHGRNRSAPRARTPMKDPGSHQGAGELDGTLRVWREKYPDVPVDEQVVAGTAAGHLVDASFDAALLVVGRRTDGSRAAGHIGPVTRAVLHHSQAPVAVVPHR